MSGWLTLIPIVMLSMGEPARSGLVESLARPGGNVTGTSNFMVDIAPMFDDKPLDLLRDLAPKLRRVALLMTSCSQTHQEVLEIVRSQAPRAGVQITPLDASSEAGIEAAFASMVKQKLQAVIVPTSPQMIVHRQLVADLALKSRRPCLGYNSTYAEAGFLLSYGANLLETFRRSAVYVDKSSRAPSRPICPSSCRPCSSSSSTRRPRRPSALRSRAPSWFAPIG